MDQEKNVREFFLKGGERITLRPPRWEDLDSMLEFVNDLVSEKLEDPGFGIITDKKQTRESEARWLANMLVEIESGKTIFLTAIADGKVIGNCHVSRGIPNDEYHHGFLGISVSEKYRDMGVGREMLRSVIVDCRKKDFKTIELEAFGNNARALHLYESVGFKRVGIIPKKMYRAGNFYDGVVMAIVL